MNTPEPSISGHIKSAGTKFATGLLGKTSISDITKIVSYNDINGNPKPEVPILSSDISHIYMGKMNEEEIGIYSDDFLKGILQYYFYCTPKGKTITIELANCVSEVLGENMQGFMNFERQKLYIQDFVEKNFGKKYLKRLEIIDLESRHIELFKGLRDYEKKIKSEAAQKGLGIGELDKTQSFDKLYFLESSDKQVILPNKDQDFNSLDIAKYLYRVCKNNPVFFDKLKAIKPEKAKSEFYPLIEIAIRLTDLLKGVHIQGGAMKQKQYDAIIKEIVNPYLSIFSYPEIDKLRKFCIEKLGNKKFETIYMDGSSKKYRTFTEKLNSDKNFSTKTRIYTSIITLALLSILGISKIIDYKKEEKLKKQIELTINQIFESKILDNNRRIFYSGESGGHGEYIGKEKIETINMYINNIYNRFQVRYGEIGEDQEIWFKSKIVDCINNQKILDLLGCYGGYGSTEEDIVIDNYFIPQNFSEFQILNIPTTPYQKYIKYTDDFINTILLEEDFTAKWDTANESMGYRGTTNTMKLMEEMGLYSAKYQGYDPSITEVYQIARMKYNGKYVILALRAYYHYEFKKYDDNISRVSGYSIKDEFKKYDDDILSTSIAKDLAIDFLKQTNPLINALLDQYLLRYLKYYGNSLSMLEDGTFSSDKHTLNIFTEEIIIKEFLKKGLIKKVGEHDINELNNFLDELVIEHGNDLKTHGTYQRGDIVQNLLPNGYFQEYEEAMQNILTDTTGFISKRKNSFITPRHSDEPLAFEESLGKYIDSKGKRYLLGLTSYKGKKYLCAREESPSDYYSGRYYTIECAKEVANDYFQTKSKFLQKKLLYEKKNKSSSQTHVNVNEKHKPDTFKDYTKNNPK